MRLKNLRMHVAAAVTVEAIPLLHLTLGISPYVFPKKMFFLKSFLAEIMTFPLMSSGNWFAFLTMPPKIFESLLAPAV